MFELLCPLKPSVLDSAHMIAPLLDLLCDLPGFMPTRYDLNQHDSWRRFDLEKTRVDALSQRVQLLRIQGADPDHLAMLSLGKRGETATFVVRLPEAPVSALANALRPHLDAIPMRWLVLTSPAWQSVLHSEPTASPSRAPVSPLMAWPRSEEPDVALLEGHPDFARHPGEQVVMWALSTHMEAPEGGHRSALEALGAALPALS